MRATRPGTRALLVTALVGVLSALTGSITAASALDPPPSPSPSTTPGDFFDSTCTPNPVLSVQYVSPTKTSLTPFPGAATKTTYQLAGGLTGENVAPPPKWTPRNATAGELAFYGFPARPLGGAALDAWNAVYGTLPSGADSNSSTCTRSDVIDAPNLTNWSAAESYSSAVGTFKTVEGTYLEPTFVAGCPHASAHSIWIGLGGDFKYTLSTRIGQAGVDTNPSSLINSLPFYALQSAATGGTGEVDTVGWTVGPGDKIDAYVNYSTANGGTYTFRVTDVTTGNTMPATVTNAGARYYDGYSAETADERPLAPSSDLNTTDGGWYYLRQSHEANGPNPDTDWSKMIANGSYKITGTHYSHRYIQMEQDGNPHIDANVVAVDATANTYHDRWYRCT